MCRPAPLTLSFSADDHTSCGHIFHAFSVFPVLLLSQLGSIRTLWIHSGDWYIAVHKHTPSSSISGSSAFHVSLRTWGWPVQHIKFCISQLFFFFFNWHCWVQEMLSTYLFLSGCKFLSEFALYMCRRVYCHRRSKGRRIAPRLLSVSSISVDTSPSPPPLHSRWKAQLVAGEYFGLFYLCTRVPVERSIIFSGHRVPV